MSKKSEEFRSKYNFTPSRRVTLPQKDIDIRNQKRKEMLLRIDKKLEKNQL